jgi:hypothetical protein
VRRRAVRLPLMKETLREHLKRQTRRGAVFVLAGLFVAIAVVVLGQGMWLATGRTTAMVLGDAVASLVIGGIAAAMTRRLKCPKCGAALGRTAIYAFVDQRHGRVDHCPRCGVNFDEPMPQNPILL